MSAREVLQSWKEISAYLGRDIRTCRRWEEHLGLPVHRLNGSPKARVLAYKDEIDWWQDMKLHEREVEKPRPGLALPFGLRLPASLDFLRHWPVVAAFIGVLAIGVLGWRTLNNGRPHFVPTGSLPSLAVLPFVNGTGDDGLNYLREAAPDHLINDLQRSAEHLTVFSLDLVAEAMRKIGLEPGAALTPDDLAAVATGAGAGWVLVGYLSKSGSKLRIDYELREPKAAAALKTDHVPGTESEFPIMEDRVADGVRRAFGIPTSSGPGGIQACSVPATRFYETARAIERKYTLSLAPGQLEKMIGLFNQAREADPGCALAYLGLGDSHQLRFVYEGRNSEDLRQMEEYYRRAYEMAPDRAETNVGVGWIHYFKRDNDTAYAYFKKAMDIDPASLHVLTDVGAFLRSIGVLERSTEYFSRVIKAGGATVDLLLLRAWCYENLGLYESALADLDKMAELDPTDYKARCLRARALILMKRYDAASADLAMAETLAPGKAYIGAVRALLAAAKGDRKAALEAVAALREPECPTKYTYFRSRIFAALGMKDQAVGDIELALERGFEDVYDYLYFFPILNNTRDYFYDKLRGDPRFIEILRRQERTYVGYLEKYSGL
jgi:TolB-like protein/Flp pilus assembly protein TadD